MATTRIPDGPRFFVYIESGDEEPSEYENNDYNDEQPQPPLHIDDEAEHYNDDDAEDNDDEQPEPPPKPHAQRRNFWKSLLIIICGLVATSVYCAPSAPSGNRELDVIFTNQAFKTVIVTPREALNAVANLTEASDAAMAKDRTPLIAHSARTAPAAVNFTGVTLSTSATAQSSSSQSNPPSSALHKSTS
jgi:hypothetical protein